MQEPPGVIAAPRPAPSRADLVRRATVLAVVTLGWNVIEAAVALAAALVAGSRALAAFGVDSIVESASAMVIMWRMRVERRDARRRDEVERRAVRLIGWAFVVLGAVVAVEAVRSLLVRDEPDASRLGIAVTALSLVVMPVLARSKQRLARQMGDPSVAADAAQTWACTALSAVVLGGLLLNEVVGWWWADPAAALLVVGFLLREGREAIAHRSLDGCC